MDVDTFSSLAAHFESATWVSIGDHQRMGDDFMKTRGLY